MGGGITGRDIVVGHAGGVSRTPAQVFDSIYTVFLVLGTLVGVVVIGYTLYNAIKYRYERSEDGADEADDVARPSLGEIPSGSGGGKKLFVSFGISAIIVLSLIAWTYSALLYVDSGPDGEDPLEVDVVGEKFSWTFIYPNGSEQPRLRVPEDRPVKLTVTSADVFHNIGIPAFNAKTDAIPGQTTTAWFVPTRTGTFEAVCYELCGTGHSYMRSDVIVMEPDAYRDWYRNTTAAGNASEGSTQRLGATAGGDA